MGDLDRQDFDRPSTGISPGLAIYGADAEPSEGSPGTAGEPSIEVDAII
jgi:hypothetical protein